MTWRTKEDAWVERMDDGGTAESFSMEIELDVDPKESRLYWVSFVGDKDGREQNLGVSIVRVTGQDVQDIAFELLLRFPNHDPEHGPWLAAVTRKAHKLGINPGGQVAAWRIDNIPKPADMPDLPEDVMLTPEQLAAFDAKTIREMEEDGDL